MSHTKQLLSFQSAQRSFDAQEHPDYWMRTVDQPDMLDEFKDGFIEVTGIDRSRVYDRWLQSAGNQPQRWSNAQEEGGFYSGVEHGLLLTIEQVGPRSEWATRALNGIRAGRRMDRATVEHVLDTTL